MGASRRSVTSAVMIHRSGQFSCSFAVLELVCDDNLRCLEPPARVARREFSGLSRAMERLPGSERITAVSATVARRGRLDLFHGGGQVLRTSLGRRVLATNALVAFGVVSAIIQLLAAVFRSFPPHPAITFAIILAVCLAWGLMRAHPRFYLCHRLKTLDVTLSIVVGDLFAQDTHLAVGFSDTFDTSVADGRVIHSSSMQGQLLHQLFAGNQRRLDQQLAAALDHIVPVRVESRTDKPHGKLARYPIGTVAVLGEPQRLIFAVAYGIMENDLVARTPLEDLWHCFNHLWEAVYRHGQRGALSIPLMGSGLARVDSLDRENLLRLILLSFVAYSRLRLICHDLRIVIRPDQVDRVDLVSLRAFLQTL